MRDCKRPHLMYVSTRRQRKICGNPGLPFTMVLCLHQSNVYIKRNLRVWRVQKCIPLIGATTLLTCAVLQTTPSHVCQYRAENEICGNLGLPLPMVPCLHQSNVYIKRKLRVWRVIKCTPLVSAKTSLTCAGLQTTLSEVSQYRAENGNLRKSGSTISHGTVYAPKQCLYQKEATGIETPKMYFSRRCKNFTYLWRTANDPVSCKRVYCRER